MSILGFMRLFSRGPSAGSHDIVEEDLQEQACPTHENQRQQEEPDYLEMDYEQEMEDCARYTFSAEPLRSTDQLAGLRPRGYHPPRRSSRGDISLNRFASLSYDCVSLRLLLGEARRMHMAHAGNCQNARKKTKECWRQLVMTIADQLGHMSFDQVRRNIACVRLFDLPPHDDYNLDNADTGSNVDVKGRASAFTLHYGRGNDRARALQERKQWLLRRLRERNTLFWTGDEPSYGQEGRWPSVFALEPSPSHHSHWKGSGSRFGSARESSAINPLGATIVSSYRDKSEENFSSGLSSCGSSLLMNSEDDSDDIDSDVEMVAASGGDSERFAAAGRLIVGPCG